MVLLRFRVLARTPGNVPTMTLCGSLMVGHDDGVGPRTALARSCRRCQKPREVGVLEWIDV